MEILEKGFSVRNIKDVLSEEMINYLIQLTDIFPFVENNKEEILRKRVSSNYSERSADDTYDYKEGVEKQQYLFNNAYHISQAWSFLKPFEMFKEAGKDGRFVTEFGNNLQKISEDLIKFEYPNFDINPQDVRSRGGLTYYEDGDFIEMHADGKNETRLCVILLYLNKDWNSECGGELVLEDSGHNKIAVVPPKFGDYVILDFVQNNVRHAVNHIKNGFKRFTFAHFIELRENERSNCWNEFKKIKVI
jgi:Rps23 Pro-64 3,4-dihydroxylase Tpa1-like proline 4-hydroxylase